MTKLEIATRLAEAFTAGVGRFPRPDEVVEAVVAAEALADGCAEGESDEVEGKEDDDGQT